MPVWTAMEAFAELPPNVQIAKLRALVSEWINYFQRSHHSSVQHLPYIHGSQEPWREPLPITRDMMKRCKMDGETENYEGYSKQTRPLAAQLPLYELPKKLPADNLYEPQLVHAPPDVPERSHKTMCGQPLSSFPQCRRIKDLKFRPNSFCVAFNGKHT